MAKSPDPRAIRKMQALKRRASQQLEPSPTLAEAIRDRLDRYAGPDAESDQLTEAAQDVAGKLELYRATLQEDGDMRLSYDVEHTARMEPVRRFRELAREMLQLLDDPDIQNTALGSTSNMEEVKRLYRFADMVEQALDRNSARFADCMDGKPGEPKAVRYMLYTSIMKAWWRCKGLVDIPARTLDPAREPHGEYFNFLTDIFSHELQSGVNISPDEAHKSMLIMQRNEREASNWGFCADPEHLFPRDDQPK